MIGMSMSRGHLTFWRRFLACALAVALVHQLGACPCGCLEGNHWYQTYLQLTSRGQTRLAVVAGTHNAAPQVDSKECDENHASTVYLTSTIPFAPSTSTCHFVPMSAPPIAVVLWQGSPTLDISARDRQQSRPSARTLRAQIQVFLI